MKISWLQTSCWLAVTGLLGTCILIRAAGPASAPATVSKEGDLTTIRLTPEAEQRLRLQVVPVERRVVAEMRTFSGEVVLPLGVDGGRAAPIVGGTLDEVLRLGELQIAAEGRVLQAQVQVEAARVATDRAQKMRRIEAGSVRAEEEAKAALGMAEAALTTAKAQRSLLGSVLGEPGATNRVWVRVAIYSGEVARLDGKALASIRALGLTATNYTAKPVVGPATANALAHTVDWYYELGGEVSLRPGERVAVEIPTLESKSERLVLPFSAVLHDFHGGQWVYEQTAPHNYTRRRIQVIRLIGNEAVLASGPAPGRKIVTDGAAELFGTEFMTGK